MNLMHLRYFCKLAETQHYTLAASELFISQPGLSGAISSLEQELGIRLFEKRGRNIHLTKYGKEFYNYVNESLNILDTGISIAFEHSGKLNGSIDIGAITTIQSDFLPMVISEFHNKYPKILFNIFQGQTEKILPGLEDSIYDIGFCSYNKPHPDMTAIPILYQKVMAVVHKTHPLASRSSINISDLRDYDILSYSPTQQIGQEFVALLKQSNLDISSEKLHFEFHNELYLAGMLMQESYDTPVGLMVQTPHMSEFPDLVVLPVDDVPENFHTVYMVYNHRTFNTHAVSLFIDFVTEHHSLQTDK